MFFLGTLILVIGLAELQKDRKGFVGYMSIVSSLIVLFVSIQDFLMHLKGRFVTIVMYSYCIATSNNNTFNH
ncbi:YczI family protein [Peribacillus phoenicis]